jgi:hypothetical protein
MLATGLGYISSVDAKALLVEASELGRILNGLIASTKSAA